jgi:hypothetical protein
MEELVYEEDVNDLQADTFRPFIEQYFSGLGGSVDRSILLEQLKAKTGVDLEEKTAKGEMSEEALNKLLVSTSVEIFPLMMPTKETGFDSVSVYLDDKGVSKNLDINDRMSGIANACGYIGQTFRGDCFMGRVFDDTEDEWRSTNMKLKDCNTDAAWVAATKRQRSNRSSSDMSSFANKIGMNKAAHINPGMLEDQAPQGDTEKYSWKQVDDEVELTFKKEGLVRGDKAAVKVEFKRGHLRVAAKGEVLFDEDLYSSTHVDESTWTLSDGVLQVMLSKVNHESWPSLTKQ